MKFGWKKLRAIALMLCCALLVNAVSFTSQATEPTEATTVEVGIMGNDGQISMTQKEGEVNGTYSGWIQECEVGTTLGDYLTIDSVTFWNPDRAFTGWMLCAEEEITYEDGSTYITNVQIPGTDIFTTEEALAYEATAEYDLVLFVAQWAGEDDDYYSEIAFDAYGGRYIYNNIYWENGEQIEKETEVESWSNRLRTNKDSIATQTAEYFEFVSGPAKDGAEFEGWLEFRRDYVQNDFGDTVRKHELVSETLYTTEEMLARTVPEYNVCYTAKWSDTELEDYYLWEGPWSRMELDGKDGIMTVTEGENNFETSHHCIDLPVGQSMNDAGISMTDPVYWTEGREFQGWMLCTWEEITEDNGNTYWDYVQVPDTGIYTTEEVLAYEFTEDVTYFVAQWSGDDDDYYSQVNIDAYHSTFTFNEINYENDEQVKYERETEGWGNYLKTCDDGIAAQAADYFEFVSEPVRAGAEFQGWLEFKMIRGIDDMGNEFIDFELVSDTVYTTEQMLNKSVPEYNVNYAAKWSDIDAKDYYQWGNIELELNGGTVTVHRGEDTFETEHQNMDAPKGFSVSDNRWSIEDPVYWNPDRAFEGWMLCTWEEIPHDDGGSHMELVQVPGTEIMTTEEVLSYKLTQDATIFAAQWSGNDDDYYTNVELDGYGGTYTVINSHWENDEKVSEEIDVHDWSWNFTLKICDEGITTQTSDWFELKTEPEKEGADFEGWVEFRAIPMVNENGEEYNDYEMVSDTVYTTEQMLNRAVPDYDIAYVAKWSNADLENYFRWGHIELNANDGTMTVTDHDDVFETQGYGYDLRYGYSLNDRGFSVADPVYWNPDRAFEGWMQAEWRDVMHDNGEVYWDLAPIEGAELMTTEQVLHYAMADDEVIFQAQWAGDDDDYYSQVDIAGYGGSFELINSRWENDEKIEEEVTTDGWGFRLKICDDGIATQAADYFEWVSDPVREDATFEGWVEFRVSYVPYSDDITVIKNELVSETLYTTEQMLSRAVPDYDVKYVAKWSDMELDSYFVHSNAPARSITLDANDGNVVVNFGEDSQETSFFDYVFDEVGQTFAKLDIAIADPVFWDEDRAFEGWMQCTMEEILNNNGGTYTGYVQIPGTELMTTEQVLAVEATEEPITFVAQWAGSDDLYYVQVDVDGYGAEFAVADVWMEEDEKVEGDVYTIGGWGNRLRKNGESIATQIADWFAIKDNPTREGAEFEGWAEFKIVFLTDDFGRSFPVYELVSDTLYTLEEMLNRPVPDYNVCYAAKWSDIKLKDYYQEPSDGNVSEVWGNYVLFGGAGDITFSMPTNGDGTQYQKMGTFQYMLEEGQTLNDYLIQHSETYEGIEKACSELVGWQVFTYDTAQWYELPEGDIPEVEDTTAVIEPAGRIYYPAYTNDRFIVMTGCEEYKDLLTTEEIFKLGGDGKNYYVTAVWSTKHKEGPEVRRDISVENGQGTYMSMIYCEDCGTLMKSWERTFTVESQEVTIPDFDEPARVDISSRVMDIPEGIQEVFEHVDDIKDAMINSTVAVDDNISAKNIKTSFMDVELKVQNGSGDWETVTHENFPEEGISILIPYPAGTGADTDGFVVSHMISAGEEAGTIEILVYTKEQEGLRITVTSLSPIMVAYAQENPFGDIKESDWYYSYAMFASNHELMGGKGNTPDGKAKFDPSNNMTRAEFVQALYSKEGKPAVEYQNTFTDVPEGKWFTDAVIWASKSGLVAGKGDKFDVNGNITRQEMALILSQYAALKGYDTSSNVTLASFADSAKVSSWATTGMQWAVSHNVIGGTAKNELLPLNKATRAEAATMIRGFMIELEGVEE